MTNHRQMREFEFLPTRSGTNISFRVVIRCSTPDCAAEAERKYTRVLPDEPVRKHFQNEGWLLGKQRSADVCPGCLKVNHANRLAGRFKVTQQGQPVPSASEVAAVAGRERQARTSLALSRLFDAKPAAAASPIEAPAAAAPEADVETRIDDLIHEIREMRASSELQVEQQQHMTARTDRVIEQNDRLIRQNDQIIEALARLAQNLLHHQEGVAHGLHNASSAMRELADKAIAVKPKKRTAPKASAPKATKPGAPAAGPPIMTAERELRTRRAHA